MSCCAASRPCRTCAPHRHACLSCGATVRGCHLLRLNSGRRCCADRRQGDNPVSLTPAQLDAIPDHIKADTERNHR